jgi:hypothetical protein
MTRHDAPRGNVLVLRTGYNPHEDLTPKRAARRRRSLWLAVVLIASLVSIAGSVGGLITMWLRAWS